MSEENRDLLLQILFHIALITLASFLFGLSGFLSMTFLGLFIFALDFKYSKTRNYFIHIFAIFIIFSFMIHISSYSSKIRNYEYDLKTGAYSYENICKLVEKPFFTFFDKNKEESVNFNKEAMINLISFLESNPELNEACNKDYKEFLSKPTQSSFLTLANCFKSFMEKDKENKEVRELNDIQKRASGLLK